MKIKTLIAAATSFTFLMPASATGLIYETKGEALIYRSAPFTSSIERRNIPIPSVIDVQTNPSFSDIRSDRSSGWTKCRVPLKSELGITGVTERSLVFDCRPAK